MLCNALYARPSNMDGRVTNDHMASEKPEKKRELPVPVRFDAWFEDMRRNIEQEMERAFSLPWPPALEMRFPRMAFASWPQIRAPLCDVVDRGDRYEMSMEVPGIEKEEVDVKAGRHFVEVSAQQSEKKEEKGKNYLYNERSYRSFYRRVPLPEEVVPSRVEAKLVNGILNISVPKKTAAKAEEESKVEVK